MKLLLDTHVVLWWLIDSPELSDEVKGLLDSEPETYVSSATIWEIAIKQNAGKIKHPTDIAETIRDIEFRQLPITYDHAITAGRLPLIHRDPFDRMLVAQARCDELTLMTRDPEVQKYEVTLLPT